MESYKQERELLDQTKNKEKLEKYVNIVHYNSSYV